MATGGRAGHGARGHRGESGSASRVPETGYGSQAFARACELSTARRAPSRSRLAVALGREARELRRYERGLPQVPIRLSAGPAGRMIRQHLAIREGGAYKYRQVQGVLMLPPDMAVYLRGRRRQAVRTNLRRAQEAGLVVSSGIIETWRPGPTDSRGDHLTPGPIERWVVHDAEGRLVADSIMSVDDEVALLHGMVSIQTWEHATEARWLLHTAIVERLCGHCKVLLVVSDVAAYALSEGHRHFQRLLGYEVARVRVTRLNDVRRAQARARMLARRLPALVGAGAGASSDRRGGERAPQELAGQAAVGSPAQRQAVDLSDRRQRGELVGAHHGPPDPEVSRGHHVGPAQHEDEKQVGAPAADAGHRGQPARHLLVGQSIQFAETQPAVGDVLGERAQVAHLRVGEPGREAQLVGIVGEDLLRCRHVAGEAGLQAREHHVGRPGRHLLAEDPAHEDREPVLREPIRPARPIREPARPDRIDHRRQPRV
jgi:hypothetical protein